MSCAPTLACARASARAGASGREGGKEYQPAGIWGAGWRLDGSVSLPGGIFGVTVAIVCRLTLSSLSSKAVGHWRHLGSSALLAPFSLYLRFATSPFPRARPLDIAQHEAPRAAVAGAVCLEYPAACRGRQCAVDIELSQQRGPWQGRRIRSAGRRLRFACPLPLVMLAKQRSDISFI